MTLEQKVVNLKLAKELVDNGIVLETVFYHFNGKVWMLHELNGRTMSEDNKPIPAPLLCEMLGVLPTAIQDGENFPYYLCLSKTDKYYLEYLNTPHKKSLEYSYHENHAAAAAKMAITLKKKGLLNL